MVYSQPFQSISPVQVQIIVRVAFLPRFAVIAVLFYPFSYSSRIPQYSLKLSEQSESLDLFIQFKERLRKWKLFFCHFKGEKYLYLLSLKYTLFSPWWQISPKVEVVVPWNFHMNWLSSKFWNCRTEKFFFMRNLTRAVYTSKQHWNNRRALETRKGSIDQRWHTWGEVNISFTPSGKLQFIVSSTCTWNLPVLVIYMIYQYL